MDIGSTDRTETITVDGTPLTVTIPKNTPAGVSFFVQNLDFSFGGVARDPGRQLRDLWVYLHRAALEIFVGEGPAELANDGLDGMRSAW